MTFQKIIQVILEVMKGVIGKIRGLELKEVFSITTRMILKFINSATFSVTTTNNYRFKPPNYNRNYYY